MKKSNSASLSDLILSNTVIPLLTMASFLALFILYYQVKEVIKDIEEYGTISLQFAETSAELPLLIQSANDLDQAFKGLMNDRRIRNITVTDLHGKTFYASENKNFSYDEPIRLFLEKLLDTEFCNEFETDVYIQNINVYNEEELINAQGKPQISSEDLIGHITLTFSTYPRIYDGILNTFNYLLVILFAYFIIKFFASQLTHRITRSIDSLMKANERIKEKDFGFRMEQYDIHEFNQLSDGFNTMVDEIQTHTDTLKDKIHKATHELIVANEALVEKNEQIMAANKAKTQFLANISHELKTPLSGIQVYNKLLQNCLKESKLLHYSQNIHDGCQQLINLIEEVLHYSEIEANDIELRARNTNLFAFIDHAVSQIAPLLYQRELKLYIEIDESLPPNILIDDKHLERAFMNLLSNAVKYTHEGHVMVMVRHEEVANEGLNLIISVMDTGIGIAPEKQNDIFNPFTQADHSDARPFEGTGLGLSIAHNIIEQMGGTISVSSTLNVGSQFIIKVPTQSYEVVNALSMKVDTNLKICVLSRSIQFTRSIQSRLSALGIHSESALELTYYLTQRFDVFIVENSITMQSSTFEIKQGHPAASIIDINYTLSPELTGNPYSDIHWMAHISQEQIYNQFKALSKAKSDLQDQADKVKPQAKHREESDAHSQDDQPQEAISLCHQLFTDKRILIVDDNVMLQNAMKELLLTQNASVQIANSGEEAIRLAQRIRFDAILMDLQMPKMTGDNATRKIREDSLNKVTPVICITAAHILSRSDLSELEALFDAILFKTDDSCKMIEIIASLIRNNDESR